MHYIYIAIYLSGLIVVKKKEEGFKLMKLLDKELDPVPDPYLEHTNDSTFTFSCITTR